MHIEMAKLENMLQAELEMATAWKNMTPKEQEVYLKAHPLSKFRKGGSSGADHVDFRGHLAKKGWTKTAPHTYTHKNGKTIKFHNGDANHRHKFTITHKNGDMTHHRTNRNHVATHLINHYSQGRAKSTKTGWHSAGKGAGRKTDWGTVQKQLSKKPTGKIVPKIMDDPNVQIVKPASKALEKLFIEHQKAKKAGKAPASKPVAKKTTAPKATNLEKLFVEHQKAKKAAKVAPNPTEKTPNPRPASKTLLKFRKAKEAEKKVKKAGGSKIRSALWPGYGKNREVDWED